IQDKVDSLTQQWKNLSDQSEERERWLTKLLALADRFWQDLADLSATLYDTQQIVMEGEPPAADTDSIRQTLSTMQNLREEIDSLQCDLDTLGILGMELMSACGDTDKPDVTKSMDELYCTWNNISKVWTERCTKLEETLESVQEHHTVYLRMLGWLDSAETRISDEFLVGVDLETVKQQLSDLKDFKRELYQQKVEVESLNHRTLSSLHKLCGETQREEIQGPLATFRERWDRLEGEIVNRQHQLESALLGLGQFQHTLDELFSWLAHTAKVLEAQRPISIDLQTCEIELAKHKVLQNDVTSHVRTVESVTQAGQDLLESSPGDNAESLESKLAELSERWEVVRSETMRRQLELENNLSQVQDVTMEMQDLLQWLEHVDLRLSSSKPVWGLPETAKEKLSIHLELCKEMDSKLYAYNDVRDTMHRLLANKDVPRGSNTEHSLNILEQKWECVHGKVQDRKAKLSEGVTIGTEFQSCAQELLRWMTQTEENLSALPPPSLLLDTASEQIQRHRLWLAEVNSYSEKLSAMEAMAIRLKDFSRKQDCTVIQNLLLTVRDRWATVSQHITERGRALEEAKKRAKQTNSKNEAKMKEEIPLTPRRCHYNPHRKSFKEFQKMVRSKRPMYEATLKSGRSLREKAQLPEDHQPLEDQLGELRDKWDTVCAKAMESIRQHKLEEALLFSGKFTDTLQALMDWLYRAEPQLSEEMPVGGDRDLVTNLIEKHKVFQKELGKRTGCIKTLKRSARDLARGTSADSQWLQEQMEELEARWETVCRLSVSKQARLEAALRQAEEFHSLVQSFLERLSESERTLKFGVVPEEEEALGEFQKLHQEFMKILDCQQMELECITSLGEEILSSCHPDSVIAIKSWVSITKTRFQEVMTWAGQQDERVQSALHMLAAEREDVDRLMDWMAAAEESLTLRDQEPLPDDMISTEELITQHMIFMEELTQKQPEVEKVTRSCKRKTTRENQATPTRRTSSKRRSVVKSQPAQQVPLTHLEAECPRLNQLLNRWQQLWFLALDRQCRLQGQLQGLRELEEFASFDFGVWRKRYMQWISHMKSRMLDVFRNIDRDQDGRISQQEFVENVLASKFPTNSLEMTAVANIFDINGDGFIDYYEFVSTLHPSRDPFKRSADADTIQDEVNRQVAQCNCPKQFQVEQVSSNRYRVS
uniref:Microtubule actin crosslinking factor 1 n=1 Tax=Latimeria chalumnae TaxID=7897 RepID=H3A191_LATCH